LSQRRKIPNRLSPHCWESMLSLVKRLTGYFLYFSGRPYFCLNWNERLQLWKEDKLYKRFTIKSCHLAEEFPLRNNCNICGYVVKNPFGIGDYLFQVLVWWVAISDWPVLLGISFYSPHRSSGNVPEYSFGIGRVSWNLPWLTVTKILLCQSSKLVWVRKSDSCSNVHLLVRQKPNQSTVRYCV
jgi:hypothetical protein